VKTIPIEAVGGNLAGVFVTVSTWFEPQRMDSGRWNQEFPDHVADFDWQSWEGVKCV